jgi:hypothetical protein
MVWEMELSEECENIPVVFVELRGEKGNSKLSADKIKEVLCGPPSMLSRPLLTNEMSLSVLGFEQLFGLAGNRGAPGMKCIIYR